MHAIQQWHVPNRVKALQGFLGLTGYYRHFVCSCRSWNKDNFQWTVAVGYAFKLVKHVVIQIPTLALLDFPKPFIIETDVCNVGVGAIRLQDPQPLAFLNKALPPSKLGLLTYKKELWAVIFVVNKWHYYLYGRPFIIRTDHQSLKFLLDQRLSIFLQQKWLSKHLGYDYVIQ